MLVHLPLIAVCLWTSLCLFGTRTVTATLVAKFHSAKSGVIGAVQVDDGRISMLLNFDQVKAHIKRDENLPNDCLYTGMQYHVHYMWAYDDVSDRFGTEECGSTYLGSHWDPWNACGCWSGGPDCLANDGCISASSIFGKSNEYQCDPDIYPSVPYACEMGDWSAKYGFIQFNQHFPSLTYSAEHFSAQEAPEAQLIGRSLVIHCGTGERLACAPFQDASDVNNKTLQMSPSMRRLESAENEKEKQNKQSVPVSSAITSQPRMISTFTRIEETLQVDFVGSGLRLMYGRDLKEACSKWSVSIHAMWAPSNHKADSSTNCHSSVIGGVFDPTHTCVESSDSIFCHGSTRCKSSHTTYTCDMNHPFMCAIGDFSARNGVIDLAFGIPLTIAQHSLYYFLSVEDAIPMATTVLETKSIRMQCVDEKTSYRGDICAGIYSAESRAKVDILQIF